MADILSEKCSSWFTKTDRIKTKGFELLYSALNSPKLRDSEKKSLLESSLEVFSL
jgi:hypothetical protein